MKNELMQKVGELLDLAGLDEEVIKSVTEKLEDEEIEESACCVKHEEAGRGTENAPVDGSINKGGEKVKDEEAEDEIEAPVDPRANEGGYNAVKEDEEEDDTVEIERTNEEATNLEEALVALYDLVGEAYEYTSQMQEDFDALKEGYARLLVEKVSDFEALKEEYAKLVAAQIIAEAEDDEVAMETEDEEEDSHRAEEENAEQHENAVKAHVEDEEAKKDAEKGETADAKEEVKKANKKGEEMRKNAEEEKKDYDKAHESLEETADKIAEDVTSITEEEAPVKATVKIAKAFSVFSNISESAEGEKKQRKAFTLFPNL